MNINFLIIAWRGFSGNKGKPTEKGLYEDGRSAINWLYNKGVKEENIIVYGRVFRDWGRNTLVAK